MTLKTQIDQNKNQITFWLNTKTYPLEAIYSAAYVFLDRAYIYLDGDPKKEIMVSLKGKTKLTKKGLENLVGEFHNELLNYLLRVEIAKRNQKIREYIVATALVSSLPVESLTSSYQLPEEILKEDWKKDPLGIAVPWEEKYNKKINKKKT
jgi:His-Xaa-Ser system protein HxsD